VGNIVIWGPLVKLNRTADFLAASATELKKVSMAAPSNADKEEGC
jgi:hypothetical protein